MQFNEYNPEILSSKIANFSEFWYTKWPDTMKTFPREGLEFLQDHYIVNANEILMLDEGPLAALLDAVSFVRGNSFLSQLVWHFSQMIYEINTDISPWTIPFPQLVDNQRNINDFIGLIILMAGFDRVVKLHRSREIPIEITKDTFRDVKIWLNDFYKKKKRWGLVENQWLTHHFTGKLYRLGRLQFAMDRFSGKVKVFQNRKDKSVIALSEGEIEFRGDGLVNGTNDIYDSDGLWVSEYEEDDTFYYGNPISPLGKAIKQKAKLPKAEWQLMLEKDQPVLDMHIPEEGRMDHHLCGQSMEKAKIFFPKYFPEWTYHAFTCTTWLFEPQFQKLLPHSSNIVKFQQEFYLYPILSNDVQTFDRVFWGKPKDFNKAPRDTSLRRAIVDHYLEGGHLSGAGGFILKDDVDWGSKVYQKDCKKV